MPIPGSLLFLAVRWFINYERHLDSIDPLHCSLLRMRDKAMSARVAIKRSSYYRNEWQITRKASFFRITTANFYISEYTTQ